MIKNHFKIAWRNLVKDKQFTLLNLLGLSAGLACALMIYLWVNDEWQVDKINSPRLFQVMQNVPLADNGIMTTPHTPDLLANALATEIPGIEAAVIIKAPDEDGNNKGILSFNDSHLKAKEMYVTDNFFTAFSCPLLDGNRLQPLAGKHSVLLSQATARKLFNTDKNLAGKIIQWSRGAHDGGNMDGNYTIAGVFADPPANASMQYDILFSHDVYLEKTKDYINWQSSNPFTYLLLKEGASADQVTARIKDFIKGKMSPEERVWAGSLFLQRYSDIYLHNQYANGQITGGRIEYVKLFSLVAVFVLLIACINFMNLATAKASRRIKETGIKKVVGASRLSLIIQFTSESLLMVFFAVTLAIVIAVALLPAFNQLTGKSIKFIVDSRLLLFTLAVVLFTGLLSGSYPAFYLSGFKPAMVLKGILPQTGGAAWIRKGLVVFQFSISVILIVAVLVVHKQTRLIQEKNLGYSKDNIIHFANEGKLEKNQYTFLSQLKNIPGVINASDMEGDMLGNHSGGGGINWPGKTAPVEFAGLYVGFDFMETMGLSMQQGRMFSREFSTDSNGVIFNETAIRMMQLADPIGKQVTLWGRPATIIGVVKDFHFESLYKTVGPFFIGYRKGGANLLAKIKAGKEKETLSRIAALYKSYNPGLAFEYAFIDEDYQRLYAAEQRVAVLSRCFAGIAILISCLGLFGLAAFTAQKRQKEIGIRKVVGASVGSLALLLSGNFLRLVCVALLLAMPVAWWAANQWLQGFAYRVHIGWDIFALTALSVICITVGTISYQALKAALANPVKSLRTE